jgi:uncharacterized protein (DUF1501 family)
VILPAFRVRDMLRILGSPKTLCDGLTRRDFMHVSAGLVGLAASASTAVAREKSFGKAKACILLFLYGSPSQIETFDPKPDAAEGIRGELKTIRSNVVGADVGELLPHCARVMDKLTVVRSMTHPHPIHGVAYAVTGVPTIDPAMELSPRDSRHWPFIGSVVDYVQRRKHLRPGEVPTNLALPFPFSSQRVGEVPRAGPYAAFLGGAYNPVWTAFKGEATGRMTKTLNEKTAEFAEPYVGISPASRFELAAAAGRAEGVTLDRLNSRRSLLQQLEGARREADRRPQPSDRYREMAYNLLGSRKLKDALDVTREPLRTRENYGMTLFGQGCLAARRVVEAGSRFVSVFWDEFGLAGSGWDTHWDHYNRMKKELCPGFDRALSGLLTDLDARGMLDETLVLCLSEHGRTPQINKAKGAGRDHWSRAYSVVLAGGGVARGKIVGKTDRIAGDVAERPVSPKDVLATAYHLLGIDPEATLNDLGGRPNPIGGPGVVVPELLA